MALTREIPCPEGCGLPEGHVHLMPYIDGPGESEEESGWYPLVETAETEEVDADDLFKGRVISLYREAEALLLRKHAMYGPKNISQAPGGPLNGLRVRMWDKLARLNNITDNNISDGDVAFESVEDTLLDLANYALIGVLVLRGDWPS